MKVAFYEANGSARDVLRVAEIPTPKPGLGEVVVKLATSGVNPSDVKSRLGSIRKMAWPRIVPHSDGAGIIEAVGDGVAKTRIGERVWVWNGQWKRPFGTAAEYIALSSAQAVRLPDNTGFAEGACLGIPAMTAVHALDVAQTAQGATVLVAGGAGSVSQYVIQFAKLRGATVITTISSPEKASLARSLGADHTIDYKREDVGARVMEITGKRGVDAIVELDLAANAKLIPSVIRPKGIVAVYGTSAAEAALPIHFCMINSVRILPFLVYELDAAERARAVAAITAALERGQLANRTAPPFKFDNIAAAHEAVEQGKIDGNVIVSI